VNDVCANSVVDATAAPTVAPAEAAQPSQRERLIEVALLFTRLGFTAFGGPPVHLAMMEEEVVNRRKWLDRQHFLDVIAAVNFIPGPNSTETAIHMGLIRAGVPGLVVAGACFITPAGLIILPIAWLYMRYGALPSVQPALHAIGAAVVAVVMMAVWRLLRPVWKEPFDVAVVVGSLVAWGAIRWWLDVQPELIVLAIAAVLGAVLLGKWRPRMPTLPVLAISPMSLGVVRIGLFFLKVGATLFGSGYVLISYLQSGLIDERHWLTQRQLLDGVAVGQFTPGPVLTTATFIGYVLGYGHFNGGVPGGVAGAVAATLGIFMPSFLLILMLAPLLQRVRKMPAARGALDAMNAAVIGLLAAAALRLLVPVVYDAAARRPSLAGILIVIASLAALSRNINSTWIILAAGVIGGLIQFIH
jgi:chromate transporter